MAVGNQSLPPKCCFFLGLLCLAIFFNTEKTSAAGPKQSEVVLTEVGPCSQFKDCNEYCLTHEYPLGGYCATLDPGAPSVCLCKYA